MRRAAMRSTVGPADRRPTSAVESMEKEFSVELQGGDHAMQR